MLLLWRVCTAQKMKFSIKNFFSKCNQIRRGYDLWQSLPQTSKCLYLTWKKKNIYRRCRHTCSNWQCIRCIKQFTFNLWNSVFTKSIKAKTGQKMKFSIKDFFSKYDQIRSFVRIFSQLLKKSLMENFIFCAVWMYFFIPWKLESSKTNFNKIFQYRMMVFARQ